MNGEEIREAIDFFKSMTGQGTRQSELSEIALQALEEQLERIENKSLTFEQLKEMGDEPVWVVTPTNKEWVFVRKISNDGEIHTRDVFGDLESYYLDKYVAFYKHKPQEEN